MVLGMIVAVKDMALQQQRSWGGGGDQSTHVGTTVEGRGLVILLPPFQQITCIS